MLLERVGAWRVDVVLRATEDLEEFKAPTKTGISLGGGGFRKDGGTCEMGLVISKVQEGTPSVLLRCSLSIRWRFWGAKNGPGTKVSGLEAFEDTHGPRFQRSNVPPESLRLVFS